SLAARRAIGAAALAGYRGGDARRRRRLVAEAEGRGTAVATTAPNNDTIWLLAPAPDGGVVSLSEDHTIRLSHGAEVTTLSGDVSSVVRVAYNPARGLIAFATGKPGVAVLDVAARKVTRITDANPDTIAFSPDGARLVVLDDHQVLHAWPTRGAPRELAPRELAARRFAVPAADRVVAQVDDGVVVLAEGAAAPIARLAASDVTALDGVAGDVVLGGDDGTIRALDAGLHERGRGRVCHDRVRSVQLVPHGDLIAFACQDRTAGVARFDAAKRAVVVVDAFDSRGLAQTYLEPTGRYIGVTDESNTAYLYDLATHLLHHYDDGNAAQPAFVLPPSAALPFVVIGDNNGAVRTWRAPSTAGRVALHAPDGIYTLSFTPDSATLIAGGVDGAVHAIDLATTTEHALAGHAGPLRVVRTAADAASALSVGFDNTARLWRIGDGAVIRTFRGHAGEIADAAFLSTDPLRVVSAGGDGRLLAWAGDDAPATELYRQAAAFDRIAVLGASGQIAGVDIESHVRVFDAAGQAPPRALALPAGAEVTLLRASPDARWLAIGTAAGDVVVFDTATWRERQRHRAPGAIRQIAFDPQGRELAVASEAGRAPAGHVEIVPLAAPTGRARSPWTEVTAMVRDVAYTPDGETLGFVTSDGGTWLYAIARDAWAYTRDHDTDTLVARFSPDGRQLATADRRGIVVVRDVAASFAPPPSTATAVSTTPSTTWSHR
ncbi:MAG TPA: WD40 repeat domain-containing protein, partial [Kofleriaceae bacterium]|nr:WD40 repeat domain-containing protein [Kofleriaceae bacterium]